VLLTQHDGITASFEAKKAPGFIGEGEFRGLSSEPLGRGSDICQHLTQHRSIEGLHQPFSTSECSVDRLVQIFFKKLWNSLKHLSF